MKMVCQFIFSYSSSLNSTQAETYGKTLIDSVRTAFVSKVITGDFSEYGSRFKLPKNVSAITYTYNSTLSGQNNTTKPMTTTVASTTTFISYNTSSNIWFYLF